MTNIKITQEAREGAEEMLLSFATSGSNRFPVASAIQGVINKTVDRAIDAIQRPVGGVPSDRYEMGFASGVSFAIAILLTMKTN